MRRPRITRLVRQAIAHAFPDDAPAVTAHVSDLAQLSMDQLSELTSSDEGMRRIEGLLSEMGREPVELPQFDEVEAAKPGRLTRVELARVLSGGTPRQWGPALRRKRM